MDRLTLGPYTGFRGEVRLPGSKSLTNRLVLLAWLAGGETRLENGLESDDTIRLREALQTVDGGGQELYLGNAGTAMRPLTAVLAARGGEYVLKGDERMHERPIGPLVEALRQLGAEIDYLGNPGYPPLRIRSQGLNGGKVRLDATLSSQFVTALLMAAPLARGPVEIEWAGERVSAPYVDMTLQQMARFGVKTDGLTVQPGAYRSPGTIQVEGDASGASYFLAAGAIAGPVRVLGVGKESCQGDVKFADVLEEMGALVRWGPDWIECERGQLRGLERDLRDLPDAAMTLAPLALFAQGTTTIRGVANWKVKETDRQLALQTELRKSGAHVEALEDGLRIAPGTWRSAEYATYHDHRMAMCMALTSLGPLPQTILDPGCVSKTYPSFFQEWQRLAQRKLTCTS